MHASRKHTPLLPKAPAYAERSGLRASWQNRRAFSQGRRDSGSEPGPGGFAMVQYSFRQVDLVAAEIDGALQEAVRDLDHQIHSLRASARTAEQNVADMSQAAEQLRTSAASGETDSVAALNARRTAALMAAQAQDQDARADAVQASLPALVADRERVHAAAASVLDAWAARANELAAHHARGYRQGRPPKNPDGYEPPRYPMPDYPWAQGRQLRLIDSLDATTAETE